jgi:sterol desaturase/sphingolipid hydroxylase (fatty acid hydroxylase superfamily)
MSALAEVYLIILPVVLIASLIEAIWQSRTRPEGYDWKAMGCSMVIMIGRRLFELLPFGAAAAILGIAWEHRLFTLSLDRVWTVLLLFIGLEFFYYWFHRFSHTMRWFWTTHSVHHSPNRLNLSAAYRLGWMGKITGTTVFFAPLVLMGFEPKVVMTALALNLLYQFWLHADWIPKLGWLEYVLNTPSAHRVHHARNAEYLDANFGGVLIVFDRLFGTYVEERADVPCEYGLVTPMTSNNPLVVNFQPWIGLAKDLWSARSLSEVWSYLFGAPGWRPDGHGLTTAELRARAALAPTA